MTSEGLGEMVEGDSGDMCAGKFPIVSLGVRAQGLVCADPGARTPSALAEINSVLHKLLTGRACSKTLLCGGGDVRPVCVRVCQVCLWCAPCVHLV
jgi:hypothetical protein